MSITAINIKIIDTDVNSRVLIVEQTEVGAPQLIYNGAEDRYNQIVASELHFNMLVQDSADANFLHLFTGNETRYKVVLEDYSDAQNPIVLWTGFLLPEQFTEPWHNGGFFVEFIATDGIGRIKNKTLPDTFYGNVTGISVVLATCLNLTGLALPLFVAPAVINAYDPTLLYSEIAVNTQSYLDANKNPYEIIEALLKSIGCKLFQYKEAWYVVGINRFTETSIEFEEYTSAGVYVQQTTVVRTETPLVFYANPSIAIQPPWQNITLSWDKNQDASILPSDIVYQPSEEPINWEDFLPIKHWTASTSNFNTGLSSYVYLFGRLFIPGSYIYRPDIVPTPTENPFYVSLFYTATGAEDADINYISLESPMYLEAKAGDGKYVSLELEFYFLAQSDISTAFAAGSYDYAFLYELMLDTQTLVSNKSSFTDYTAYNFEMDQPTNYKIHGTLKLEKVPLTTNGVLDLKLSAPLGAVYTERLVYTKVEITFNSEDETYEKKRNIGFSTKKEIDVFHSDDNMEITNRQFRFIDSLIVNVDIPVPAVTYQINILNKTWTEQTPGYGFIKWYISYADFLLIQANPLYLYANQYVTNEWLNYVLSGPEGNAPIAQDVDGYYIWELYDYNAGPAVYLLNENTIWIVYPEYTEHISDKKYLREHWRRYEQTEDIRYIDALARVYHDTVKDAAFKITGDVIGFIDPFEVGLFKYIEGKSFVVAKNVITMGIDKIKTAVTMVEATKQNVNDYVAE